MNRIIKIFIVMLLGTLMFSCSPDQTKLGNVDVAPGDLVEGLAFTIEHDAENPNIVYLKSLMDSRYTPQWDHPQGRSQAQVVTLKIPFAGTYEVKFGVQTRGGMVYAEPVTFTVEDFYAGFVDNELWTLLSGGKDHEKTWYLDLDQPAVSRYFLGPLYFYGTNDSWESVTNGVLVGGDSWNWKPDYKGNSWLMTAANFGSMTFDLKGGANVKVVHSTIAARGTETGTYMLNTDEHTMRLTDASPLHDIGRDGVVVDWGNIKILSLTAGNMQLAVLRDPALSGEGACLLVYNFISKDYFDNWVPPVTVEPEPPYEGDPNGDLTTTTSTKKKWGLSLSTPYNWTGLGGNFLNSWSAPADYVATGWAPYDEAMISNVSLTFDKATATTGSYEFTDGSGNPILGNYTLDDKNNIIFDKSISFGISGWVSLETTAEKKLRIIKTETDAFGNITKLWLGKRASDKDEYMVYAFEPKGSGAEEIPETVIAFDNAKLKFGNLEGNGKFRLELYNDFGDTKNNPPLNPAAVVVNKRITIKFTLGGITLKSGAAGSYKTAISLADADWSPQYWGDGTGPGEAAVTGNGTYTIWYEPASTSDGAVVFVIDIPALATDIQDLSTVTATINSIKVL